MQKHVIVIVCLCIAAALSQAPIVIEGISSDQSVTAVTDGKFLYQGTYSDPAKIVKLDLETLEILDEIIIANTSYLSASTFDETNSNMFFLGKRNTQTAIVKVSTENFTLAQVAPIESYSGYYKAFFPLGKTLALVYDTSYPSVKTAIICFNQNDLSIVSSDYAALPSGVFAGAVPDPTNSNNRIAVFIMYLSYQNYSIVRYDIGAMSVLDSRPAPAVIVSGYQQQTAYGEFIFFAVEGVVYKYDLDTLSQISSLSFAPHAISLLQVDRFNPNIIHIDHKYKGSRSDPKQYPYNYVRAAVDTFSLLDNNAYMINITQLSTNNFIGIFNGSQIVQYTNLYEPEPYASPILVKVNLDDAVKQQSAIQRQGTSYLTGVDVADNSLIMVSSASIIKKPLVGEGHQTKTLPLGVSFNYNFHQPRVIFEDKLYGYYTANIGIIKVDLSTLELVENKTIDLGEGNWIAASKTLIFYYLRTSNGVFELVKYDYTTESSTVATIASSMSTVYGAIPSSDNNYLYFGMQNQDEYGVVHIRRFNLNSNAFDLDVSVSESYLYLTAMALDPSEDYLIITLNINTYKIKTSDLSIVATINSTKQRWETIAFNSQYMYTAVYDDNGSGNYTIQEIDFESFKVIKEWEAFGASASNSAYDSCTDTLYFIGWNTFMYGQYQKSSNGVYIGRGGNCSNGTHTTSSTAPTDPSNISGRNNANQSNNAAHVTSITGILLCLIATIFYIN